MIINIRGTSGSGKSTLINRIGQLYVSSEPFHIPRRKAPFRYLLTAADGSTLTILGQYETACGGCDTLPDIPTIFDEVASAQQRSTHVLFEGLLISSDVNRTVAQHYTSADLVVVHLNTPLDACLAAVNDRRKARGEMEPVNPKNTSGKYGAILKSLDRLKAAGVPCYSLDREAAFRQVADLLFPSLA